MLSLESRSASTTTTSSEHADKGSNVVTKMRGLRARSPYALFVKDRYAEISAKNPGTNNRLSSETIDLQIDHLELKLVAVSKKMSEAWKTLPEDKKQVRMDREFEPMIDSFLGRPT